MGHSVKHDLNALGIADVKFVDTSYFEDKERSEMGLFPKQHRVKKLKDLAALYLNAQIQESYHSSVSKDETIS